MHTNCTHMLAELIGAVLRAEIPGEGCCKAGEPCSLHNTQICTTCHMCVLIRAAIL